jgi:hypothetical protein
MAALELAKGDVVTLDARVLAYTKNRLVQRRNGRYLRVSSTPDYKFAYPSRLRKLAPEGVSA